MASFNKVVLVGNLTRDIELKQTPGGTAVASVSVAVNKTWKDANGNKKEKVSFVDCELWGRTAEVASEYLGKGSQVLFCGELEQDTWQDKETGKNRSKMKVRVSEMTMLGGGKGDGGGGQSRSSGSYGEESQEPQSHPASGAAEDVPF